MSSSEAGVWSGVGDARGRSATKLKGALWGSGEVSMGSGTKGDDEGMGGVVTSHRIGGVVVPSASSVKSAPQPQPRSNVKALYLAGLSPAD